MNEIKKEKRKLKRKTIKRKTGKSAETSVTTVLYCFRFWGTPGWLKVTYVIIILNTQRFKMVMKHNVLCRSTYRNGLHEKTHIVQMSQRTHQSY